MKSPEEKWLDELEMAILDLNMTTDLAAFDRKLSDLALKVMQVRIERTIGQQLDE